MDIRLDGKIAVITGSGSGQGQAVALVFAAAGAHVFGCDLHDGNLETAELVRAAGGVFTGTQPVDLGDPEAARQWVEAIGDRHGRIDILYNNASKAKFAPFHAFTIEDWQSCLRNELSLPFYVTRFAWRYLTRPGGVVINIASTAGMTSSKVGGSAHAATKGALISWTRQLASEGGQEGIRVVALSPGAIETPATAAMFADPAIRDPLMDRNLLKKFGQPNDVAALALFLASDAAGHITGSNFVVDGGRTS